MQTAPGIIVLDGTDVAGKTTLAKALIEKYGGHYLHCTYRWKDRMHLYHLATIRMAIKKIQQDDKMVIVDRWWPSEMVYGDVYRGGARVPNEGLRILHRLGLRHGVTYVICFRDRDKILDAYTKSKAKRQEMYDADERMVKVHDGYELLYNSIQDQRARWHHYNLDRAIVNRFYFEAQVDMIGKCSQFYNYERCLMNNVLPHSVGAPMGDYLFVGERINRAARALDYPWIAFTGASLNMARSLGELGIPEHRICWTNAYLPDGTGNGNLIALLKILPPFRKVVAMGAEATKFCQNSGRCDFSMPHPAYLTRFNGPDSLTRTLGEVFQ